MEISTGLCQEGNVMSNVRKSFSPISEKHKQININLTDDFNFIGQFFKLRWVSVNQLSVCLY